MLEQPNENDLAKGKMQNLLTTGAMGLGLLSSANVQADAGHVHKYVNGLKSIPGITVQNLNQQPDLNIANHDLHLGKFKVNVRAIGGGGSDLSNHNITMHGPAKNTWSDQDHRDHENAKYVFSHLNNVVPKLMQLKRSLEEKLEPLEKKCPRCGKASASSGNPSGRCSKCLKKLRSAKKTPGHWQRAQTKADDALRRQDGKNGTASHKSSGRGSRDSIVKQVKRAERKTGRKLSPDRKNNNKGYETPNTRMVPEHLNRGRHKVDNKKLKAWQKRLNKTGISCEELYSFVLAKAQTASDTATRSLLDSMNLDDLINFVSNGVLEKNVTACVEEILKDETPNTSKWTRLPNTLQDRHSWQHPVHGNVSIDTSGGKYKVMHNSTMVGDFTHPDQAVEMTRRYLKDVGVKKSSSVESRVDTNKKYKLIDASNPDDTENSNQ